MRRVNPRGSIPAVLFILAMVLISLLMDGFTLKALVSSTILGTIIWFMPIEGISNAWKTGRENRRRGFDVLPAKRADDENLT